MPSPLLNAWAYLQHMMLTISPLPDIYMASFGQATSGWSMLSRLASLGFTFSDKIDARHYLNQSYSSGVGG